MSMSLKIKRSLVKNNKPVLKKKPAKLKLVDKQVTGINSSNMADIRHLLDGATVPGDKFSTATDWYSFEQWAKESSKISNPDQMRMAIYYGFQPLFDVLISREVPDEERPAALSAIDLLIASGSRYLTSYYTGRPDVGLFRASINEIKALLPKVRYVTKMRNIDTNNISANDILLFLRTFATKVEKKKIVRPDTVIGCACGSAEIAMSLADLFGANIEFIRRSHRRGDGDSRTIVEHGERFRALSGKNVLVVEDYVCSGDSLGTVMRTAQKFGAASVVGASINASLYAKSLIKHGMKSRKFFTFQLKE